MTQALQLAILPGDGIGEEITRPCVELVQQALRQVGEPEAVENWLEAGAGTYTKTGNALPDETIAGCRSADAILLAAMGDPNVRYEDGTEIVPQIELRFILDLYAGMRPARSVPGVAGPLADPRGNELDIVLIRESTEGLFDPSEPGTRDADRATDTQIITRKGTARVSEFAFKLAQQRKAKGYRGHVTSVDKANVFKSMAFWRDVFDEAAANHPDIEKGYGYIDAVAMEMVRRPWIYDVMVTENMYGDILSDLAAGLIGGLGYAPSADIGDDHAVFQPCHGSAPDIAGKGIANPTAMFLSGAMMLDWLAVEKSNDNYAKAAALLTKAVDDAFRDGTLVSTERGGDAGVEAITSAVQTALSSQA
ncbi:isocitrate/isopropylmalate dehydrogenase family protein [Ahrensia sp. R2A130]|uniref:isocitrate/isopropylmalate dehydrogenase family protein n=1 Tax=Ahrensia sp. R2A130 TaxID=744979 RepID=UPI0001E09C57|nr:isocitrate/isopropylmalate family dehydrogenase [Ahrensia sp. R2A130]EFL88578.1 3-isopropylmalate dehydrogenase [Ahrensia sp. R2A130]